MGVLGFLIILIFNIVCMLLCTMIIAALTLIERKVLSLVQRRVGPFFVGYRGRLQYIADALKLFIKGIIVPDEANKFWFVAMPSVVAAICYTFWMNSVWGPSISIFETWNDRLRRSSRSYCDDGWRSSQATTMDESRKAARLTRHYQLAPRSQFYRAGDSYRVWKSRMAGTRRCRNLLYSACNVNCLDVSCYLRSLSNRASSRVVVVWH